VTKAMNEMTTTTAAASETETDAKSHEPTKKAGTKNASGAAASTTAGPVERFENKADLGVMETYPQFCDKYADTVEDFMKIPDLAGTRDFLLQHADVLLQENACNYLLLASLEDEMNGNRDGMKLTARQSQIITNIAELAKTVDTHPGNVIQPFFKRLEERVHLEEFLSGVKAFQDKIVQRAVVKRQEMDAQREQDEAKSLKDIPKEQRLGPGGLDPLEVIETLPDDMVKAFESRDVEQLKEALLKLDPEQAEYHMKRCVDSGLWSAGPEG
jgi:cell division cycle protein 37